MLGLGYQQVSSCGNTQSVVEIEFVPKAHTKVKKGMLKSKARVHFFDNLNE